MEPFHCFWFRRDLRLDDNRGLARALAAGRAVQCVFIFDDRILGRLSPNDRRMTLIHSALIRLQEQLAQHGATLWVLHGEPETVWSQILSQFPVRGVFANGDPEPYPAARDARIHQLLQAHGAFLDLSHDHWIHPHQAILKDDGTPYTVFTPYFKKWESKLRQNPELLHTTSGPWHNLRPSDGQHSLPELQQLGFNPTTLSVVWQIPQHKVRGYGQGRDFPALDHTTGIGPGLRFGWISPRQAAQIALQLDPIWLSELAWRDFFAQILAHFPQSVHQPFNQIRNPHKQEPQWREDPAGFERWAEGKTGYPWIDAGMRQLNATGHIHNRVRMAIASFLCKHLLIDWRLGERHTAGLFLDYDMASNVGNWQWAAGTGCDAQPWHRIFNPTLQQQKFDPQGDYVRHWVPEWEQGQGLPPMVDHAYARQRALGALGGGTSAQTSLIPDLL